MEVFVISLARHTSTGGEEEGKRRVEQTENGPIEFVLLSYIVYEVYTLRVPQKMTKSKKLAR